MSEVSANPREPRYEKAYFAELRLQNVRAFGPEAKLNLRNEHGEVDRWTVIVGENATGKSTLLESIHGLRPVLSDIEEGDVLFGPSIAETHHLINHALLDGLNESGKVTGFGYALEDQSSGVVLDAGKSVEFSRDLVSAELIDYRFLVLAYTASRRVSVGGPHQREDASFLSFLDANPQSIPSPVEGLLKADHYEKLGGKGPLSFTRLSHIVSELLPEIEAIRAGVQPSTSTPTIFFRRGNLWTSANQSGYGYLSTLAWVLDFAFKLAEAFPDLEDPLQAPAVCLVDEIDLHLHPKWQRTIVGTLLDTFPNVQFIVTAHSPIMVQASAGHNIVLLRRNEETGFVDIVNDVDEIANWRLDQILTSELFGFDSARPAEQTALMRERIGILSQPEVREAQKARLAELEEQIGPIARGETADEVRINQLLDAAIDRLTKKTDWP